MQITNIPMTADDLALTQSALEDKLQALSRAKSSPLNTKLASKVGALLAELRNYAAPAIPQAAPTTKPVKKQTEKAS